MEDMRVRARDLRAAAEKNVSPEHFRAAESVPIGKIGETRILRGLKTRPEGVPAVVTEKVLNAAGKGELMNIPIFVPADMHSLSIPYWSVWPEEGSG